MTMVCKDITLVSYLYGRYGTYLYLSSSCFIFITNAIEYDGNQKQIVIYFNTPCIETRIYKIL